MDLLKHLLRETLILLKIDLTINLKYDRLTKKIIKEKLKVDSNCLDIGCHKGEILDLMLKYAPNGKHCGFEPIPIMYEHLKQAYDGRAMIYPYALSDENGKTTFNYVKNAPAYSGIKQRHYDVKNPDVEKIQVELKRLDDLLSCDTKIDFIKIDVEGAEFGVLKGAKNLILKQQPILLFEYGKGASEYYGTTPQAIFDFINQELQLGIFLLDDFLREKRYLRRDNFILLYEENKEYYFVAAPKK